MYSAFLYGIQIFVYRFIFVLRLHVTGCMRDGLGRSRTLFCRVLGLFLVAASLVSCCNAVSLELVLKTRGVANQCWLIMHLILLHHRLNDLYQFFLV